MSIERYSHVMHIGSTVAGEIPVRTSAVWMLWMRFSRREHFPEHRRSVRWRSSVELENNKRGIYGGAIGYIDFTGNLDTCIAIRIAYKKNGKVFVRSGAGIVADSVPVSEYNECLNKARAVMNAVNESDQLD